MIYTNHLLTKNECKRMKLPRNGIDGRYSTGTAYTGYTTVWYNKVKFFFLRDCKIKSKSGVTTKEKLSVIGTCCG